MKAAMRTGSAVVFVVVFAVILVDAIFVYSYIPKSNPSRGPSSNPPAGSAQCKGSAACFTDSVRYIVDGDTLDVGSTWIRLALVNRTEVGQPGYTEGKQFTAQTCPVGSNALVDEDDGQTERSYG